MIVILAIVYPGTGHTGSPGEGIDAVGSLMVREIYARL
jgi:hypothetical protein